MFIIGINRYKLLNARFKEYLVTSKISENIISVENKYSNLQTICSQFSLLNIQQMQAFCSVLHIPYYNQVGVVLISALHYGLQ